MTSGTPAFLDPPPARGPRPPVPYAIGCEPIPVVIVDHPRLGRVTLSERDYRGCGR